MGNFIFTAPKEDAQRFLKGMVCRWSGPHDFCSPRVFPESVSFQLALVASPYFSLFFWRWFHKWVLLILHQEPSILFWKIPTLCGLPSRTFSIAVLHLSHVNHDCLNHNGNGQERHSQQVTSACGSSLASDCWLILVDLLGTAATIIRHIYARCVYL